MKDDLRSIATSNNTNVMSPGNQSERNNRGDYNNMMVTPSMLSQNSSFLGFVDPARFNIDYTLASMSNAAAHNRQVLDLASQND